MSKFIDALVERALADSKRLKNAVSTAKETALDLGRLALQVAYLAREMRRIALVVEDHNRALGYVLKNQSAIYKEVVGGGIDTSLPNMNTNTVSTKKSDKDKPN